MDVVAQTIGMAGFGRRPDSRKLRLDIACFAAKLIAPTRGSNAQPALLSALLLIGASGGCASRFLNAENVAEQVGRSVTVCDRVASAFYAEAHEGSPTYLNFGLPNPRHSFSAVIWREDRSKFVDPEATFLNQDICVTGLVEISQGKPQIVIRDSSQLSHKATNAHSDRPVKAIAEARSAVATARHHLVSVPRPPLLELAELVLSEMEAELTLQAQRPRARRNYAKSNDLAHKAKSLVLLLLTEELSAENEAIQAASAAILQARRDVRESRDSGASRGAGVMPKSRGDLSEPRDNGERRGLGLMLKSGHADSRRAMEKIEGAEAHLLAGDLVTARSLARAAREQIHPSAARAAPPPPAPGPPEPTSAASPPAESPAEATSPAPPSIAPKPSSGPSTPPPSHSLSESPPSGVDLPKLVNKRLRSVKLFYGTNRARANSCRGIDSTFWTNSSCTPEEYYSGTMASSGGSESVLEVGTATVSFSPKHKKGEIERPEIFSITYRKEDPNEDVVVRRIESFGADYDRWTKDVMGTGRDQAFIYVHGYATTFADASRRAAQVAFDLDFDVDPKLPGLVMLYSWPSRGDYQDYLVDSDAVTPAVAPFIRFLNLVKQNAGVHRVHIIAHSMGNLLVANALSQMQRAQGERVVDQLVLAAPDIWAADFKLRFLNVLPKLAERVTLYVSDNDRALVLSSKFRDNEPRAGQVKGGLLGATVPAGVFDAIDASTLPRDFLGHSYYASNSSVMSDIYCLLRGTPPERRPRLVRKDAAWHFRLPDELPLLTPGCCQAPNFQIVTRTRRWWMAIVLAAGLLAAGGVVVKWRRMRSIA